MPVRRVEPSGLRSGARTVLGAVTVAAGGGYALFLLGPLLGSGLDPARSYVSELAVPGQPGATLFRLTDLGVGLVVTLAGVVLARTARPRPGSVRTGPFAPGSAGSGRWLAGPWFAVFGLGTVLDAAVTMPCAPSADVRCAAATAAELIGPHDLTSLVSNSAALVGMALIVRCRRCPTAPLERICLVALPAAAATGLVAVLQATVLPELDSWVGWAQRAQVLAISAVLVGVGAELARGACSVTPERAR